MIPKSNKQANTLFFILSFSAKNQSNSSLKPLHRMIGINHHYQPWWTACWNSCPPLSKVGSQELRQCTVVCYSKLLMSVKHQMSKKKPRSAQQLAPQPAAAAGGGGGECWCHQTILIYKQTAIATAPPNNCFPQSKQQSTRRPNNHLLLQQLIWSANQPGKLQQCPHQIYMMSMVGFKIYTKLTSQSLLSLIFIARHSTTPTKPLHPKL